MPFVIDGESKISATLNEVTRCETELDTAWKTVSACTKQLKKAQKSCTRLQEQIDNEYALTCVLEQVQATMTCMSIPLLRLVVEYAEELAVLVWDGGIYFWYERQWQRQSDLESQQLRFATQAQSDRGQLWVHANVNWLRLNSARDSYLAPTWLTQRQRSLVLTE